jgi:hypothetical protein
VSAKSLIEHLREAKEVTPEELEEKIRSAPTWLIREAPFREIRATPEDLEEYERLRSEYVRARDQYMSFREKHT